MNINHPTLWSRRKILKSAGAGFGYLALAGLLGQTATKLMASEAAPANPLAPKKPNFKAKAKRIIFVYMSGAMSQFDTFAYKPALQKDDGKSGPGGGIITGSKFAFKQYGQSASW